MDYIKIINSLGLIFDIIGAVIMFWSTPKVSSIIDGGRASDRRLNMDNNDSKKNYNIRLGMTLLGIGFTLQLIATIFE